MQREAGPGIEAHNSYGAQRWMDGAATHSDETVAEEVPVALVYNGISHAVMLATPTDLEDFALGFSLSECIVGRAGEIHDLDIFERDNGIEVHLQLSAERAHALKQHRRSLAGRTGCGLCGKESLDQLARRAVTVQSSAALSQGALPRALAALHDAQRLFHLTGAVHAAAWCDFDGGIELVREDVGRHNALDKLIGALASRRNGFDGGFVLMTSRASFEIVQKAAAVGIAVVAAVSAPTGMAVRVAIDSGVTLVGFVRGERHCVYSHPERVH
ncbi:MAG: formate dehydrogenase accessory sulfurtransferase FdhD [Sulfuritalea sp.]|nr:formate dehydrogenase accessory sulfurtransferase FdhD [Sulfuritalea sp.]MDP1982825.1 formate dehydrogenase accessory sulfurtransferase FdhD [Sulfuritalea sp.]